MQTKRRNPKFIHVIIALALSLISVLAFADTQTLGSIAENITTSFSGIAKLITGGSYLAGVGFAMAAIMKFKAHKDNPQQIPVGTPIALVFVAAAMMFLPTVYSSSGVTIFGTSAKPGQLSGVSSFS